jgi:hypothetical protein
MRNGETTIEIVPEYFAGSETMIGHNKLAAIVRPKSSKHTDIYSPIQFS